MPNLQKIIKVTQAQYDTLAAGGTVGSYTGLNDNYLYLVPKEGGPMIFLTYAQLKALRDNSQLVPGQQYRITDYQCTTTTSNTSSAGHQFDIIVVADEVNKLNEKARAALHSGDTYFANSKLEAWQLWYCLDNDTTRFAWPLIPVEAYLVYNHTSYLRRPILDGTRGYCWYPNSGDYYIFTDTLDAPNTGSYWNMVRGTWTKLNDSVSVQYIPATSIEGEGVIYRMIDEFDNDVPYDFKNILFTKSGKYTNAYTFSYTENNVIKDASISGLDAGCYSNIMKKYTNSDKQSLNFNVFYSTSDSLLCHDNTIGAYSNNNTAGRNFSGNAIGKSFTYNTIGNNFYDNTIANDFAGNTIGNNFFINAIGDNFNSCTIGNYFDSNTIGNNFRSHTIGNYFSYNTIGNWFFGNKIGTSASTDLYVRYCQFDDGVQYISLTSDDTSATSSNWLQNVHVHSGVKGTSSSLRTISVPDRNLPYSIDYYANNSQSIFLD